MQNRTPIGPQTPYEVYCYQCRVTFPVGTSRCIHCGRPIGAPAAARDLFPNLPGVNLPGSAGPEAAGRDEVSDPLVAVRKFGGVGLWLLVALGAALSRACNGS